MSLEDAPFSAKGIAPFLVPDSAERAAACARASNLIFETRRSDKVLLASTHLIGPLLALLPVEPAAAGTLATLAYRLTEGHAYPEALTCIDAIIDLADAPVGDIEEPWSGSELTWSWQQALLWLWRGEGLLAAGDREGGEAALAEGARRAEAAAMPSVLDIGGARSGNRGTVADWRLLALMEGARALRLRFEGKDACMGRKVKKRKASEKNDHYYSRTRQQERGENDENKLGGLRHLHPSLREREHGLIGSVRRRSK